MNWDTDKILGSGLVLALILFLLGEFITVITGHQPLPMEIAGTIVTGLVGYMGRSLAEKLKTTDNNRETKNTVKNN